MNTPVETISIARILNIMDPVGSIVVESVPCDGSTAEDYARTWYGYEHCEFAINGARVTENAMPHGGDQLLICPIPGDGAGKALAMVAAIVITIYAPYAGTAIASYMGWGAVAAKVIAAAIMVGGYMAINAMLPNTQVPSIRNNMENIETSTNYGWGMPSNAWQEGEVIPRLIGERRFAPPRIGGYRFTPPDDRETQHLRMQFCMCGNRIVGLADDGSTIWVNERPLYDYPEVAFEYTYGIIGESNISRWFEDTYTEQAVNAELHDAELVFSETAQYTTTQFIWFTYKTPTDSWRHAFTANSYKPTSPYQVDVNATVIAITLYFPKNLAYKIGESIDGWDGTVYDIYDTDETFQFKVRYREIGESTWSYASRTPNLRYPRATVCDEQYKYYTFNINLPSDGQYELGFTYDGDHGDHGVVVHAVNAYSTLSSIPTQVTIGTEIESLSIGIYFPQGLYYLTDSGGTSNHTVGINIAVRQYGESDWTVSKILKITDSTRDAFRKVVEFKNLSPNQWEVMVFFSGTPNSGTRYVHTCYFEYLQEGIDLAVSYQGCAILSLDMPANESLNNTWPTVEVRTKCVYEGADFIKNYFDNTYWTPGTFYSWMPTWDSINNEWDCTTTMIATYYAVVLLPQGTWHIGYRPNYFRVITSEALLSDARVYLHDGIQNIGGYANPNNVDYFGQWLSIDNWASNDLAELKIFGHVTFSVIGIEFASERFCDSSNPAAAAYHKLIDEYAVESDDIVLASFQAWEDYCCRNNLTVSGYQDTQLNRKDVLDLIGEAGRATVQQRGSKFYAIIDDVDEPVQTFSSDNIITGTFEEKFRSSRDLANTVVIYYYDAANDNRKTPVKVRDPNIDNSVAEKITEHTLYWVNNASQAVKYAVRLLNATLLSTRTLSWQSDIDAINCSIGNVVWFQNDLPVWGATPGRATASTSNTVTCDIPIDFDGDSWDGRDLRIIVRHTAPRSGQTVEFLEVLEIVNPYPNTNVTTYTLASGSWERNPETGCMVTIGWVTGAESSTGAERLSVKKVRIVDISHAGNTQRRKITALEYYDDMHDDSAAEVLIPEVESGLSVISSSTRIAYNLYGRTDLDYISLSWRGNASLYYVFYRIEQIGSGDYQWYGRHGRSYWKPTYPGITREAWMGYPAPATPIPPEWDSVENYWIGQGFSDYSTATRVVDLTVNGSWVQNFRPTHMRVTFEDTSGAFDWGLQELFLFDASGNVIVNINGGTTSDVYDSGDEVAISWQGRDIRRIQVVLSGVHNSGLFVTNIEFYDLGSWSNWRFLQTTSKTRLNIYDFPSGHKYQFSVSVFNAPNIDNLVEVYFEGADRESGISLIDDCIHGMTSDQVTLTTYSTLTVNDSTHGLTSDHIILS